MDWLKNLLNALNPANWGIVKFFTKVTGPDTKGYFTKKEFDKGAGAIPPAAIILYRGRGDISGAIRKITEGWSNHAGLYFGSGKRETVEALWDGIGKHSLDKDLDDKTQLIIFHFKPLTVVAMNTIKGFAYGACGKKYNYDGVKDFVIDDGQTDPGAAFCSQLVTQAYAAAGIKVSDKPDRETSPVRLGNYLNSAEARAAGWEIWDTRNITTEDAKKALTPAKPA